VSKFKNKNALITGEASGYGLQMAIFAIKKEVQKLVIWDINESALKEALNVLQKKLASCYGYKDRCFINK